MLIERLEGEVEVLERLARWEAGEAGDGLGGALVGGRGAGGEQFLGEARVGVLAGDRRLGDLGQQRRQVGQVQVLGELFEALFGKAAHRAASS